MPTPPADQRNIPSHHSPLALVVDASGSPIQIGLPSAHGWIRLETDPSQAMQGIFHLVHKLFDGAPLSLKQVSQIYFCEGPGSTLGLRLAAAFVKTLIWQRGDSVQLFQYNALDLAMLMPTSPPPSLQAPFRRGRRFVRLSTGENSFIGEKKIMEEEDAIREYPQSLHIPDQRGSNLVIPSSSTLAYDLQKIKGLEDLQKVSLSAEQPLPYSPEPMTFKKWEPSLKFV